MSYPRILGLGIETMKEQLNRGIKPAGDLQERRRVGPAAAG